LFALAYILGGDGIENARPGNFFDAFFFSVQTMASIGYGAMYPKTLYANVLVTIEALLGLIGLAMATGLMFARFSLPKARVMFSSVAVMTPYNGMPTLMFRVANERQNWILEAQIRVSLVRSEITKEGDVMRRFYDMSLVRSHSPLFALTWTVMHPIDESSPLYGVTPEEMVEDDMEVVVTLTGLDETVTQTIHTRHSYVAEEIFWNMRFVDILSKTRDGRRSIDYTRFHDVIPIGD
jgi:inward rectifier potassium channel